MPTAPSSRKGYAVGAANAEDELLDCCAEALEAPDAEWLQVVWLLAAAAVVFASSQLSPC